MTDARNAQWYVYELVDPRDGLAFYVGKCQRDRIHAHEKEAKSGKVCSEKVNRIKEIWDSGLDVEKQHVALFWDEQAAYDYEAARVAEYGLDSLTNIMPGGGSARGSYICRDPKPWTAEVAVSRLLGSGNALGWFARWLRGEEFGISGHPMTVGIVDAAFRHFFPALWETIQQSRAALDKLAPRLLEHGVELKYGSA